MNVHLPVALLIPHEEVNTAHVADLLSAIETAGSISIPILVEKNHMVILDGHHRYAVAKALGYTTVPVQLVDYNDVDLEFWRTDIQCTKEEVIRNAQRGALFPCKTTRHRLKTELL